jgi:hypothetical protein
VAGVFGVCVEDAVGGGVVSCCVHGIGAGFVEGGLGELGLGWEGGKDMRTGNRTSREMKPVILTILKSFLLLNKRRERSGYQNCLVSGSVLNLENM